VQLVEFALQLNEDLSRVFAGLALQAVLAILKILTKAVALEQFDHLRQAVLQGLLRLFCFYFCHGALHPRPGNAPGESINQYVIGKLET
jgi:hypothetical protein